MGSVQQYEQLNRSAKPEAAPDHSFWVWQRHVWETVEKQGQHDLHESAACHMSALTKVRPVPEELMQDLVTAPKAISPLEIMLANKTVGHWDVGTRPECTACC